MQFLSLNQLWKFKRVSEKNLSTSIDDYSRRKSIGWIENHEKKSVPFNLLCSEVIV